ncbi:MAG: helix-turn-helix domain-containing protein [candidate division WOR-3 bacterium]|uniref:XRE family transcriptional regulator n=1 Tax=candidate division WOR-3 bacterium TaxID=2052148 RepID=A0A7C1SG01_UNCW3|nr:helix-turn-helix domain-containing protein [candidate division WOR-3 bacterium]
MAKRKSRLEGLAALGSRLRELRLAAGISQMKLAEILGLNPTHGYKYILRLEKGLVPNPTLRTITGYLHACNAGWQDIADVITEIRLESGGQEEQQEGRILTAKPSASESVIVPAPALSVLTPASALSREKFWQLVHQALERTRNQLINQNISPASWRAIFTYIRSVCHLIMTDFPKESPNPQLEHLTELTARQGLEPGLLRRLLSICLEVFEAGK